MKKLVLTGTRPSGIPHLGNYFGAYKPAVDLQNSGHQLLFFLADYHALNSHFSPAEMRQQSLSIIATMLAIGFDASRSFFYSQSHIPEVCELAWILACQAPYGMILRAHSLKDAQAKNVEVNMGVVNYPILMAADILLYDAHLVPVGKDQKQHLEMARDLASRFNSSYGELFVIPEPLISDDVAVVPGTDGEKMSKSKNNTIPLFASDADWKKACMSIVSDSKGLADSKDPDACNIFRLYRLVEQDPAMISLVADKYRAGGYGYGHAKLALLEAIKLRFGPMRDRYFELMSTPEALLETLVRGSTQLKVKAQAKLANVRRALGVIA